MKPCNKCKVIKPLSEYKRRTDLPDGRSSICKACYREIYAQKEQEKSKDKIYLTITKFI